MNELATAQPTFEQLKEMAKSVADSRMFGIENPAAALTLMMLCQAEGLHPIMALRRYHIVDGRPTFRADALQGEFEKHGVILWHSRTDQECAATFFARRDVDDSAVDRAKQRYKKMKAGEDVSDFVAIGELTIIRTFADAVAKRVAMSWKKKPDGTGGEWIMKHNWQQSGRQMLHARTLTEGVRAVMPGLIAGVYSEDEITDIESAAALELEPVTTVTPEDRVRQATANRTGSDDDELPGVLQPGDVVCHIGQADGDILNRKVSEIKTPLLIWLRDHYGDRWANPPLARDATLLHAVKEELKKREQPPQDDPQTTVAGATVTIEQAAPPDDSKGKLVDESIKPPPIDKETLVTAIRNSCLSAKIKATVLFEYLRGQGLMNGSEKKLSDLSIPRLSAILENWNTVLEGILKQ